MAQTADATNSTARKAALARRRAMSSAGKAGISTNDRIRAASRGAEAKQAAATSAQAAETPEKDGCGCGCKDRNREPVETDPSQTATRTPTPMVTPKLRSNVSRNSSRAASLARRRALSSRGKAGISTNGLTQAQTARAANPNLSGRELAQTVREQRSRNGSAGLKKSESSGRTRPVKPIANNGGASDASWKVGASETTRGQIVTGTMVGRDQNVTGDEPSTCRDITGTEYMGADIFRQFCQSEPAGTPPKVRVSVTGHGGRVTGNELSRNSRVTGDEPGRCKIITGDEYIGQEQYQGFCEKTLPEQDRKVNLSQTLGGTRISSTMLGRSGKVTGDESGACKPVTGTPYVGSEHYNNYCKPDQAGMAMARAQRQRGTVGAMLTGLQPGIGGVVTGDRKGACEPLTGTSYVGTDQFADACPATPAELGSPDFPKSMGGDTPWGKFSVNAPLHASQSDEVHTMITGTRYEQGQITGPFAMAGGKVTGTEQSRFGQSNSLTPMAVPPASAERIEGRIKSRITGEGMDAGLKITGDDWNRGDNITGTEGTSATHRNPTRQSASAMPMQQELKRNEELVTPVSKVTGGSGNTEKGALVTYSGGARG